MQDLFSIHNQAYFQKRLNLHVVKNENEQVFYQELEVITKAIKEKKKILPIHSFIYFFKAA